MRILEAFDAPVRTVAVSPDGRFVAASADRAFGAFDWHTGEPVFRLTAPAPVVQFAFDLAGRWLACGSVGLPLALIELEPFQARTSLLAEHAGGVAAFPDGKKLIATQTTSAERTRLAVWELPGLRARSGFDDWPTFARLAVSRNGEFVAGIGPGVTRRLRPVPATFEVRFAASGGKDYHFPPLNGPTYGVPGFISFARDSGTCAFGWAGEFHVLDLSTGTTRYVRRVEASYRGAAFTGSGQLFATAEDTGRVKLWDARAWQVVREYDWQCGPLTDVAFTADGAAGVCATAAGQLVQFDVDE
ncbi:MAG: hypothetical protein FJ304_20135 [Planctomycetes bacterium]|nr:hypothetical protein [Planctomycetota bacterium]